MNYKPQLINPIASARTEVSQILDKLRLTQSQINVQIEFYVGLEERINLIYKLLEPNEPGIFLNESTKPTETIKPTETRPTLFDLGRADELWEFDRWVVTLNNTYIGWDAVVSRTPSNEDTLERTIDVREFFNCPNCTHSRIAGACTSMQIRCQNCNHYYSRDYFKSRGSSPNPSTITKLPDPEGLRGQEDKPPQASSSVCNPRQEDQVPPAVLGSDCSESKTPTPLVDDKQDPSGSDGEGLRRDSSPAGGSDQTVRPVSGEHGGSSPESEKLITYKGQKRRRYTQPPLIEGPKLSYSQIARLVFCDEHSHDLNNYFAVCDRCGKLLDGSNLFAKQSD